MASQQPQQNQQSWNALPGQQQQQEPYGLNEEKLYPQIPDNQPPYPQNTPSHPQPYNEPPPTYNQATYPPQNIKSPPDLNYYPQAPYPSNYPQYNYPPPQMQQQQQQIVIVGTSGNNIPLQYQPVRLVQTYVGHVIFSCFVVWCFFGVFGIAAFVLAIMAQSRSHDNPAYAAKLGRASIILSSIGIIIGCVICVLIIVVSTSSRTSSKKCYNSYYSYSC